MVTLEHLQKELASMQAQRDNAAAVMHQATGAIALLESLIAKFQPAMTLEELRDGLGAKSVEMVQ